MPPNVCSILKFTKIRSTCSINFFSFYFLFSVFELDQREILKKEGQFDEQNGRHVF